MPMQEPDVEIEYVSAPQDFDSLSLEEPAAASQQPAPAQPEVPEQPAAPMEDPDSPAPLDRQASAEMDDGADGLTGGLGSHTTLGLGAGLGATAGLGMPTASASDGDEPATTSGIGAIPAWAKAGGIGFARASDQQPRQITEAERAQARLDLQRVMAHFTSAEELTGTAPVNDADEQGEDANVASKKVDPHEIPFWGVGGPHGVGEGGQQGSCHHMQYATAPEP